MSDSIQITDSLQAATFKQAVLDGLSEFPKRLPCKYFYDQRGSELFDQICDLDEYYLTRTEQEIMNRYATEMGAAIGTRAMLVEYGSGSSIKTRILLDHLPQQAAYVPVDISHRHLHQVASGLREDYPDLEIIPIAVDFTTEFEFPTPATAASHSAVYFPGSTIGNFEAEDAVKLLRSISRQCGPGGGLLIGIDLVKDTGVLEKAYDDPSGITADFNLNLLHRISNELQAQIELDAFEHVAFWNKNASRIEIFIRSLRDQTIQIDDRSFSLVQHELIHTEYSHKYTIEGFARLAAKAGLTLNRAWTDDQEWFAVVHLVVK